jgi:hypothetical protein
MAQIINECGGQAIHRSFPYALEWPDLSKIHFNAAVVMTRDWSIAARSQANVGHVADYQKGLSNLQVAYPKILEQLGSRPWVLVSLEALYARPELTIQTILGIIPGLHPPAKMPEIRDENAKYIKP